MDDSKEERLKIAVFIDFDNISIGVKQSLGKNFDVGTVLEAIKEKGQLISKIAYGDWKRNEDFSRAMTQHAVQMVQRNLTPGGDKNGADIALALDALEMAFTRDHINAFVIVGGDSDFIALVEKLKQYDKLVFVVGGRAFTSVILQKNCHEFISYENLIGVQSGGKRSAGRQQMLSSPAPLETALPLVRRSLKILSDREVSPQLGLLKSTLLQLDSTFSERDYGVSSFRDFMQKLANAGYVNLKQVDRSLLVELKDISEADQKTEPEASTAPGATAPQGSGPSTETSPTPGQPADVTQSLLEKIRESKAKPHWPLYLRSFKNFLRSLEQPFDERQFGVTSTYDLVRQAQKDGLLHVERNRQGILRIYPGELYPQTKETPEAEELKAGDKPERAKPETEIVEASDKEAAPPEPLKSEAEAAPSADKQPAPAKEEKPVKRTRARKSAKSSKKTGKTETVSEAAPAKPEDSHPETEAAAGAKPNAAADAPEKTDLQPQSAKTAVEPPVKEEPESETKANAKKPEAKQKRKSRSTKTPAKKAATTKSTRTRKSTGRKTAAKSKPSKETPKEIPAEKSGEEVVEELF